MKNLLLIALLAGIYACQPAKKETSNNENVQSETKDSNSLDESQMVVNPNLASEAALTDLGLSKEMVAELMENRPFLTMNSLDVWLGKAMDSTKRAELYKVLFVPFNINTTPEKDFKMIPGVGDRMAHEFEEYKPYVKLAQFRKEIGKYVDEEEVARLEQYIFVPVELNTASEEDILTLPGVGERMAHEFEEYRPYESMEQFRKEIGKYVDEKELSRLERFVYIK